MALLVLAVGAVGGWFVWTARAEAAAREVLVTAEGGAGCAPPRARPRSEQVLVVAGPGSSCSVRIAITNTSDRAVTVKSLDVGLVDSSHRIVRVAGLGTGRTAAGPVVSEDGVALVDLTLAPGDAVERDLRLVYNPDYCFAVPLVLDGWPTIEVAVGGGSFVESGRQSLRLEGTRGLPEDGPSCSL